MSESLNPEQQLHSILKNISVGGNLTTGDISQILNLFVVVQQPNTFIPKSAPYNIPSSNTIKFVGRVDALEQVHQALQQNSQVAITAIEGMGGVGKTELATQYSLLHLLLDTYPGGICWLRARDEDIGIQILRFAETKLGIKSPEDWEIKNQVDFIWSQWQKIKEGEVLIVLDDVNNYPVIQPYFPSQLSQFKLLITTRLRLDLPFSFALDILTEDASIELLEQWIGKEKIVHQLLEGKELCLRLGNLPIALSLVGRYIKKRKISLAEMLQRLEKKGLQHMSLNIDKKDRTWSLNIQRGVAAAFELSWEELSQNAQKLGCFLSLFALAPIPWMLVEQLEITPDKEDLEDARIEMENLHLIQYKDDHEVDYQLHQLVRDFFNGKINKFSSELKPIFCKSIANFESKIPAPYLFTHQLVVEAELTIPHIIEAVSNLSDNFNTQELYKPYIALGKFYNFQGQYKQGEFWLIKGLTIIKDKNLIDFGRAQLIRILGFNYYLQKNYHKSISYYLDSLKMYKELKLNIYIGETLDDLGKSYMNTREYINAEKTFIEALNIRIKSLNKDHIDIGLTLHNLGCLFYNQSQYLKAKDYLIKSLAISVKNNIYTFVPRTLTVLSKVYMGLEQISKAETTILKAKLIIESNNLSNYPYHKLTIEILADIYFQQSKFSKAIDLYQDVLNLYKLRLGEQHPSTINCKNKLEKLLFNNNY